MGRRRRHLFWLRDTPPFPCAFGCGRELEGKFTHDAEAWEWFTGYGDGPVHFCPTCRRNRSREIDYIRERANVRPANYPDERIELMAMIAP